MDKRTIDRILNEIDMNKTDIAEALGVSRATFYRHFVYGKPDRTLQLALLGLFYQKKLGNILDHDEKR